MNKVVYFEECGHRRKGEYAVCKNCNKKFVRRIKSNTPGHPKKQCCSRQCGYKLQTNRIKVNCHICNKEVERTKSSLENSRSGLYFCGRECKEYAQSIEGNCHEIQPLHYDVGKSIEYRARCAKLLKKGCRGCEEKQEYKLVVHHRDGDRTNNKSTNWEVVCWNCHVVRHLKKCGNIWVFDYKSLTPRNMIKKLT